MGSLSFGISELKAVSSAPPVKTTSVPPEGGAAVEEGAIGWYRLLGAEEGEFYNVPCVDEEKYSLSMIRRRMEVGYHKAVLYMYRK